MVLFRHTLCKVSSGGAIDAVALNGFAGEDFGPSDCRAVVRPNVPKLAIDATAGCCGCEVSDGLCLVSLPGAASYYESSLSLPLYPTMHDADVERVVATIASLAGLARI